VKREEWKKLREMLPLIKAEIIRNILESEGIPVMFKSAAFPFTDTVYFGMGGMVDVLVPEKLFKQAESILSTFQGGGEDGSQENTTS